MNEDERQRQMDFILNQQAQFASDIQKLQEAQAKLSETQAEQLKMQTGMAQIVNRLASVTLEGFNQTNAKIDTLIDAQIRMEGSVTKLAEAQTHTEQRLDALIDVQINTEGSVTKLAEAQAHTEQRLDALINAQMLTEGSLAKLAEAQAHTEQRLDALIDIVREGRNGKP
jgi:hypothetical protein